MASEQAASLGLTILGSIKRTNRWCICIYLAEAPLAPVPLILTDALWNAALAHAFCIYLAWQHLPPAARLCDSEIVFMIQGTVLYTQLPDIAKLT
jgi:hypothetical protein